MLRQVTPANSLPLCHCLTSVPDSWPDQTNIMFATTQPLETFMDKRLLAEGIVHNVLNN